ncbi:hypothetical protein H0274_12050 [Altererythrobacter sp. CC-YST694]|uniref:hypothetical protein n=1 Tax=Altererythrobacter sp. CC-YST694 TaxID=2755038 RepID=UPI001D002EC8|nr:hypothetical protein [Altererythrobacter sp. CC-YST694]MCB5425993.1 hypothetical protein [Altererythrobacter sp. CC-YST694]
MRRTRNILFACAATLALGGLAQAQSGGSSPPEGLVEGQGAGFAQGHYAALDALPDWGGVWFLNRGGPGTQPKLKGEYQSNWDAWKAEVVANNGVEKRNRSNCSPPGMPRIMQLAQYPYEFIFSPGRVTINQEAWMQTRTIWTDGRTHPPLDELDPTYMGHSIGHWEGDTLVVDTVGILDMLPFANGALHSDKFHVTERIHLSPDNPDVLMNEMVMEDPEALAEPFKATATYRRDRYGVLFEFQCSENNRNPVSPDGETVFE